MFGVFGRARGRDRMVAQMSKHGQRPMRIKIIDGASIGSQQSAGENLCSSFVVTKIVPMTCCSDLFSEEPRPGRSAKKRRLVPMNVLCKASWNHKSVMLSAPHGQEEHKMKALITILFIVFTVMFVYEVNARLKLECNPPSWAEVNPPDWCWPGTRIK
jgi:hypothetical protein